MHTPVTKRQRITIMDAGSKSNIAALAAAAMTAEKAKKRRGSIRSASTRTALTKVPATNPSCTALLNIEAVIGSRFSWTLSAGTMAEAENQSPNAATIANVAKAIEGTRRAPMPTALPDLNCSPSSSCRQFPAATSEARLLSNVRDIPRTLQNLRSQIRLAQRDTKRTPDL